MARRIFFKETDNLGVAPNGYTIIGADTQGKAIKTDESGIVKPIESVFTDEANNIVIGASGGTGSVTVNGYYTLPNYTPSSGEVLGLSGSTLHWVTGGGGGTLASVLSASNSTGAYDILMGNGTFIKSDTLNTNGKYNRLNISPNYVQISTDEENNSDYDAGFKADDSGYAFFYGAGQYSAWDAYSGGISAWAGLSSSNSQLSLFLTNDTNDKYFSVKSNGGELFVVGDTYGPYGKSISCLTSNGSFIMGSPQSHIYYIDYQLFLGSISNNIIEVSDTSNIGGLTAMGNSWFNKISTSVYADIISYNPNTSTNYNNVNSSYNPKIISYGDYPIQYNSILSTKNCQIISVTSSGFNPIEYNSIISCENSEIKNTSSLVSRYQSILGGYGNKIIDGTNNILIGGTGLTCSNSDNVFMLGCKNLSISGVSNYIYLGVSDVVNSIKIGSSNAQIGFFGATAVSKQSPLTSVNNTSPNTGDSATNTLISNMRTRINELESRLQQYGLL